MADISFLLLIFFLVTTSMDVNQGLARRLPAPIPPDQKVEDTDINKRNTPRHQGTARRGKEVHS